MVRAAHLVARGRIGEAFAVNPLDVVFLLAVVPAVLGLWITNRAARVALRIEAERRERVLAVAALVLVVAANWIYVLATQRSITVAAPGG